MKAIKKERFNTNNAWGFGGGIGTETTFDNGIVNRKGKAYYRHSPSVSFDQWFIQLEDDRYKLNKKPKEGDTIFKVTKEEHGSDQYVIAPSPDEAMKIAYEFFKPIKAEAFLTIK